MGKPQLHEDGNAMVMMNYTREDKDQSEVMVQYFSKEGGSAMAAGRSLNYRPFSGLPNYLKKQLMTLYSQNYSETSAPLCWPGQILCILL